MKHLHDTGHQCRTFQHFETANLVANFPETYVDIGWKHPVLRFQDVVQTLSARGKLEHLVKDNSLNLYQDFWNNYRALEPDHPIFKERSAFERKHTLPVLLHADEGTSQKKRGIMVISVQPVVGNGTSKGGQYINYVGHSFTTRFLYTTIMQKFYRKKNARRLTTLVDSLAKDMNDFFRNPVMAS